MTTRVTWLAAVTLVVLVAVAFGFEAAAQSQIHTNFLVAHVRVFDGERVHEEAQVAVEEGIVRAVGRDLTTWRHLPVVDGTGATLIPGLIDSHGHVASVDELRQALRFGVTTMLDMGAVFVPQAQVFEVRSQASVATDIADLRSAGYLASARRPPDSLRPLVSSVEDATAFVAARHAEGSDYLKMQLRGAGELSLSEATAKAFVGAAHAHGMLVVAHVETLDDVAVALDAGVEGLAHVWRIGGASPEIARRVAERGVFVTATLSIPDGFLPENRESLLRDPRFRSVLSDSLREHLSGSFRSAIAGSDADELRAYYAAHAAGVQSLHAARVKLLVGTDASTRTPTAHGISVHRELELLVAAGLSPVEALAAATVNAATAFRLTDRGRIAAGLKADMVLVRGDPTSDVTATRDILRVWRSGIEFDRRLGQ